MNRLYDIHDVRWEYKISKNCNLLSKYLVIACTKYTKMHTCCIYNVVRYKYTLQSSL